MAPIPQRKPRANKDRERLIRTFQTRNTPNPRARLSNQPNTVPANLDKKPGIPKPRQFAANPGTLKRSEGSRPPVRSLVPGYGQAVPPQRVPRYYNDGAGASGRTRLFETRPGRPGNRPRRRVRTLA